MKAFVAVFASALAAASAGLVPAALPASTLIRAPAHDSASIESHRLGGNFAYATAEAHAYANVVPKLATQTIAVGETTHVHTPAAIKTVQPAPIIKTTYAAQPILKQEPIIAHQPVIGPVAKEVTYSRPVYKTRTYTQTAVAQHHAVVAQPAVHTTAHVVGAVAGPAIADAGVYAAGIAAPALAHGAIAAPALGYAGLPAGLVGLPAALPAAAVV